MDPGSGDLREEEAVGPREAALLQESASSSGTDINRKPMNDSDTSATE